MQFFIANSFTESLKRLTNDEQKAVKVTAFNIQSGSNDAGEKAHPLNNANNKGFWSVRVSRDLRIILHKTNDSTMLCYVDHHDKAYVWAERRKYEPHPTTGAAQIVEIRELVEEIAPPRRSAAKAWFAPYSDEQLLSYGVPMEWLGDVRALQLNDDDSLMLVLDHLPSEASEALLNLATGSKPRQPIISTSDPFAHPDAMRRFRIMANQAELAVALESPWERWIVFLHPDQRQIVERTYEGSARVIGSAGTGKTIVALHRAVFLARRNPDARILLTTLTDTLAKALKHKLRLLISEEHEPRLMERIDVRSMKAMARRLYEPRLGKIKFASQSHINDMLAQALHNSGHTFNLRFVQSEWSDIVDAWQLHDWESYRDVARLGRKTKLPQAQRAKLWEILSVVEQQLVATGLHTEAGMYRQLADHLSQANSHLPYDFIVVDEAQDLSISQLRLLKVLGSNAPDGLFFAGDIGQRIFQQPFSWKSLGIDIRGRSQTLRVNYRTSHQIRSQADRLLAKHIADVDGEESRRDTTISVFNGPAPQIHSFATPEAEQTAVAAWLNDQIKSGIALHECAVFVRSEAEFRRAEAALKLANQPHVLLSDSVETSEQHISLGTMHLAKGLEFKAVVVMACDSEIIPSQERIETIGDTEDLADVYATERHLLYVACTRARDKLFVSGVKPISEFLEDLA